MRSLALTFLLSGCAIPAIPVVPPPREGPELAAFTPAITPSIVDRDAAQPTYVSGTEVRRLIDGSEVTLATLPDGFFPLALRAAADDDIWSTNGADLWHYDGARWEAVSLAGAVEHVLPVAVVWIDALAAVPGEAWALVEVRGQSDADDYFEQLCHLDAGVWSCVRTGLLSNGVPGQAIAIAGGSVWVVPSDGQLYRVAADGTLVLASDGFIDQLNVLDDGSITFIRYEDGSVPTLRRIADGNDSILASDVRLFAGHNIDHLFVIQVASAGDGSCFGTLYSLSGCTESVQWSQIIVFRLEAAGLREIGHHDADGGGAVNPIVLPLPDDRVVVVADGTYVTQ